MKIAFDTLEKTLNIEDATGIKTLDLYSKESFDILSQIWLKVGWNEKYPYTFSWMGRPIIQLPEDVMRIQEVIYQVKPDVIVETGVAHGGSLILYASLFKAMGKGRVIGIDIEIREHNRKAIEAHELSPLITLIEGSSVDKETLKRAGNLIKEDEKVLVILDSNHTYSHVAEELEMYSPLVTLGSYIVATDGSMEILHDVPRGAPSWNKDNPAQAARDFAKTHPNFKLEQPKWPFNESNLSDNITHWPSAWLQRIAI